MIILYFTNGEILLYDADDWLTLRKEYRIVGQIVGNSLHVPSLPVKILPEEACLLIEKNIVRILESPKKITKTKSEKVNLDKYEDELLDAQTKEYKKTRRQQIETVADKIIANQSTSKTKEEIVDKELKKIPDITKYNIIWPTNISAKCGSYDNLKTITLNDILKLTTPIKRAVYSDLWKKGYYITEGDKFGGHFLVYSGDPVCYHALFIVRCTNLTNNIFPLDLIGFGRLGTSVKKKSVWAALHNNTVSYITMSWIDA